MFLSKGRNRLQYFVTYLALYFTNARGKCPGCLERLNKFWATRRGNKNGLQSSIRKGILIWRYRILIYNNPWCFCDVHLYYLFANLKNSKWLHQQMQYGNIRFETLIESMYQAKDSWTGKHNALVSVAFISNWGKKRTVPRFKQWNKKILHEAQISDNAEWNWELQLESK